jgi:transposase
MSTRQAAARYSVSISAVGEWGRLKRSQGDVRPARQGKPPGSVLDGHGEFIFGMLSEKPDTTLEEMVTRLAAERDIRVVWTTVWKFLHRHGQTVSRSVPT